jgi:pimeloyl-ACP methyl ester carboxylesterase
MTPYMRALHRGQVRAMRAESENAVRVCLPSATRRSRTAALALTGTLLVAAVGDGRVGAMLPDDAAAERGFRPAPIEWTPCESNPDVQCGTLTLPVDYDDPRGDTFDMAVARIPAGAPDERIGVFMTNPGGPGFSGVDFVTGIVAVIPPFAPIRERFDVVSFDPRGTGRSRPIQCEPGDVAFDADAGDDEIAAAFDAFSREYAASCSALDGDFIAHLSTNNVARDMDMLRRALGEREITYSAGSYGTLLGAVYASHYPRRVRAMALDGGVDPTGTDFFVEFTQGQMEGFELELQRIDVLCRRDVACRLAERGVVAAFDEVVARLDAAPITMPSGTVLNGDSVTDVFGDLMYSESAAPLLVGALADAYGGDYAPIERLVPGDDPTLNRGAIFAIRCNDYGTRRSASESLLINDVMAARSPRFFGDYGLSYRLATCANWPAADPPLVRNVARQLKMPMLLALNDFDLSTPPASMRSLAHALGMEQTVIRYAGGGHTFNKADPCMLGLFVDYLIDLTLPPVDTVCPGRPISFGNSSRTVDANAVDASAVADDSWWGKATDTAGR